MQISKINLPLDFENPYWKDNFKDLRNYMHFSLGGGTVRIEAHVNHYNVAIYEAVKKYYENEWLGVNVDLVNLDADKNATLPSHIEPALVRDVIFEGYGSSFSQFEMAGSIYNIFYNRDFMNPMFSGLDISQFVQSKQKLKDLDKALGTMRSWELIGNKISCYPKGLRETRIGILYGAILLPNQLESDSWIQSYAVAHLQHILGSNRRKFSGFQASGGTGATDGDQLIQEAIAAKDKLIEEIKARRTILPIMKL
jgi:hypothetical protein